MFHIVLIEPEIPHNAGAAGRLALATDSTLHLVEPLGFSLEDKYVRRTGLDYWQDVKKHVWKNFDELRASAGSRRTLLVSQHQGQHLALAGGIPARRLPRLRSRDPRPAGRTRRTSRSPSPADPHGTRRHPQPESGYRHRHRALRSRPPAGPGLVMVVFGWKQPLPGDLFSAISTGEMTSSDRCAIVRTCCTTPAARPAR